VSRSPVRALRLDWWTTLMIASAAADLRRYHRRAPTAYLQDGLPPNAPWGIKSDVRMPQDKLKATMAHLAAQGPRDFYEGDLARSLAADVALSRRCAVGRRPHAVQSLSAQAASRFPIAGLRCSRRRN